MDISRMKKLFAGISAVAITVTQVGVAVAAYSDVPAGVWYEDAVDAFTDAGYLDASQTRFRGGDNANRAEFTKLVVELNGGILSTPPAVPSFDDVAPGAWYYGYMEEAGKEGWVKGDNNCYGSHPCWARPGANINRAEAAALIVRAFGLDATGDAPSFVDVPSGQWYTGSVQTAADHCVLQGDDNTGRARPADFMNRAEMVVMLNRVDMGLTYGVDCSIDNPNSPMIDDVTPIDASTLEVEFNVALDADAAVDASKYMVSGDADIDVTSASMVDDTTVELMLADSTDAGSDYTLSVEDMMTDDGETFSDSADFSGYTEIEQGDGILEVSVASTNPAADTVPQGAQGVVLQSVDLTASCDDDVVITELTVLHEGYGDDGDITGVYAAVDGARVTRKRTLDSEDQTADLRFTDPLMVDACDTITVDIVADFDTSLTAGAEHNLAIELPSDFQSNALDVEGNFPIRGNTFRIAAVTSGQVTLTYRTVSPDTTEVGKTTQVVGKFEVSSNSVEDQTLYSITLENNGTASDGDITNIRIRRSDGTILTNAAAQTTSDFVTLVFDPPFTVLEGDNVTLEVVADVEGGAAETVQFQLEETSDLFAVGSLYGYGVNGQLYGSRVTTSGTADVVTIDAGQLTIEIDGPTQQKYTADDDDAVLAKVLITSGQEAVDIQDLFFIIKGQTSTGATLSNGGDTASDTIAEVLEDVELRNTKTGETISATRSTVSGHAGTGGSGGDQFTFQVYRFDDFIVDGSETWEFRADFIDAGVHPGSGDRFRTEVCTAAAGCTFSAGVTASTTELVAEGESSGDEITDIRPGTTVAGNYHRIATPGLTVSVKSIGATETAVKNTKNVNLLRFEARAGEGEDILLTSTAFEAAAGSLLNAQNYTLWVDTDGDGVVDTILEKGVAAESSTVTFGDLAGGGYVVPADETIVFEVHADIASSLTSSTLQLEFADTGAATTYVEAEEVDNGSSLTLGTDITVSTTFTSKVYTLVNAGDLFVIRDDVVRARQLLGGTLADEALRLNFRAQNEDIDVTDLQISTSGSLVMADSIDRVELYKAGETTAFASATLGACGSDTLIGQASQGERTFCAAMESHQLVVEKGENIDVLVRPRMKTDENGARSSSGALFWTGTGGVQARGMDSSTTLIINDNDSSSDGEIIIGPNSYATNTQIRGSNNMAVLSKITTVTNANPDASNTNIPIGTYPLGQFRFTAATNTNSQNGTNKATITGVIFTITSTNVNMSGSAFRFYNKSDAATKAACSAVDSTSGSGSLKVNCPNLDDSSVNTAVDSGQSSTFVLEGVVENPQVTTTVTSTLQVSIQNFSSISNTTYANGTSNLVWADKDTSSRTFFWIESADTVVNSTSYRT